MPFHYGEDEGKNIRLQRMMDFSPEQTEFGQKADDVELSSEEIEGPSMDDVEASLIDHLDTIEEARTWSSCGAILINSPTTGLLSRRRRYRRLPTVAR